MACTPCRAAQGRCEMIRCWFECPQPELCALFAFFICIERYELNVKGAAAGKLSGYCLVGHPHYLWFVAAKPFYRVRTIAGPRSYRNRATQSAYSGPSVA